MWAPGQIPSWRIRLLYWRAGYYLIDLNPKQAMQRLGEPKKPWEFE
jgi:hypothetical protein